MINSKRVKISEIDNILRFTNVISVDILFTGFKNRICESKIKKSLEKISPFLDRKIFANYGRKYFEIQNDTDITKIGLVFNKRRKIFKTENVLLCFLSSEINGLVINLQFKHCMTSIGPMYEFLSILLSEYSGENYQKNNFDYESIDENIYKRIDVIYHRRKEFVFKYILPGFYVDGKYSGNHKKKFMIPFCYLDGLHTKFKCLNFSHHDTIMSIITYLIAFEHRNKEKKISIKSSMDMHRSFSIPHTAIGNYNLAYVSEFNPVHALNLNILKMIKIWNKTKNQYRMNERIYHSLFNKCQINNREFLVTSWLPRRDFIIEGIKYSSIREGFDRKKWYGINNACVPIVKESSGIVFSLYLKNGIHPDYSRFRIF